MANDCVGLIGKLLGHNYEAVFEIDEIMRDTEDVKDILQTASLLGYLKSGVTMTDRLNMPKQITRVYRYHVCTRCGHKIENEAWTL